MHDTNYSDHITFMTLRTASTLNQRVEVHGEEFELTYTDQERIDSLWVEFLNTGDNYYEKGYMLSKIPARLRSSWGQSCLTGDSPIGNRIDSATPDGIAQSSGSTSSAAGSRAITDGNVNPPTLAQPVSPAVSRSSRDRSITVATSPPPRNSANRTVSTRPVPKATATKSTSIAWTPSSDSHQRWNSRSSSNQNWTPSSNSHQEWDSRSSSSQNWTPSWNRGRSQNSYWRQDQNRW